MKTNSRDLRLSVLIRFVAVCLLFLLAAGVASPQSGRRLPNRGSKQPTESPQEPEPAKQKPEKEKLNILVVPNISSLSLYSGVYGRAVGEECAERLRQAIAINAVLGKEMNRKEASDWAKEHQNSHVVWFEIKSDRVDFDPTTSRRGDDPNHISIDYTLFATGTGKTKTSGRVLLSQVGGLSDVVVGLPSPRVGSADYLYRKAGRAVADRILDALKIPIPSKQSQAQTLP